MFHPRDDDHLGYVIELDGRRVYHAGDTDHIPEMDGVECDVALLPVSGTYVMTAEEAADACGSISAEHRRSHALRQDRRRARTTPRDSSSLCGATVVILPNENS